ncbi:MAG TPA: APC family permease, partial [Chloroflexota bacterium]|nr:APC family permease [Chloroflexota bacterium]
MDTHPDATGSSGPLPGTPTAPRTQLSLLHTVAGTLANLAPGMTLFLGLPSIVAATGAQAPWAYALAALAMLAVGNTMREFARVLPGAGSFVTFISQGVGAGSPRAGTLLGTMAFYLLLLSFPITQAAGVVFMGWWGAGLLGWNGHLAWAVPALALLAPATVLLLRGVTVGMRVSLALFLLDAIALVLLLVGVTMHAASTITLPLRHVRDGTAGLAGLPGLPFALAMFSYIGWENAGSLADEMVDPRRTIPRTILFSVGMVCLLYMAGAWATVAGFAAWHGTGSLAHINVTDAGAPLLALARHDLAGGAWLVALIGVTSPLGCFLAEVASQARIIAHGAQLRLLPPALARVSPRTQAPSAAILLYVGLTVALCLGPALWPGSTPGSIAALEAGIGTVPILLVYLAATLALPIYMLRARRDLFDPLRHLIIPGAAAGVLLYGIAMFVRPDQPAPGNGFWLPIVALLAL